MNSCSSIIEVRSLISLTTGLSCLMGAVSCSCMAILVSFTFATDYCEGNYESDGLTVIPFYQPNGSDCLVH